jgi:hypothetical protein
MEPQATQALSSSQAPASPQQPASPKTTPRAPRIAPPSFERCRARTRQSARCRLHADPATGLCPRHQHLSADPPEDCDVLDHFQGRFDDLTTALTINDFLRMVAYLLVQNKISNRRAAVLTTLCGHLLRTVPLIDKEMEEVKSQPDSSSSHRDAPSNPAAPQANATPSWRLPLSPSTSAPPVPPAPVPPAPQGVAAPDLPQTPNRDSTPKPVPSVLASADVARQCPCSRCTTPQATSPGRGSVRALGASPGVPDESPTAVGAILVRDFGAG